MKLCSCQMTFLNHEELSSHSCLQIKTEPNASGDKKVFYENENFEYEINPQDFATTELAHNERSETKDPGDEENNSIYDYNLDLSEEFIIFILKQIDGLCENIKVGS